MKISLPFQTLEVRVIFQVMFLVEVFHCSFSILPLPAKLSHVFQDAKPFLLLLFQVGCCHLQALTGVFSQLPPRTSIAPKRLTFSPWAPIKIHYFFSHRICCNWSSGSLPGRTCWVFLSFIVTETFLKMAKFQTTYVYTLGTTMTF